MEPRPKKANGKNVKRTRREKASITAALKQMEAEGVRVAPPSKKSLSKRAARKRKKETEPPKPKRQCPGTNGMGEPCKAPVLKKGTVVEEVAVTGEYCLFHDPDIPPDAWKKNKQLAGTTKIVSRSHTLRRPMDLLADAVSRAPQILFQAHLDGLGLEWDPDSQTIQPKLVNGKRARGATHIGFSREGEAKKSRFKDTALQAKLENDLADRLYGKARMAMDLAGEGTIKMPEIPQTLERAREVAQVLAQCNALPPKE